MGRNYASFRSHQGSAEHEVKKTWAGNQWLLVNVLNRGQSENIDVYTSLLAKVSCDLTVNACRVKRSFIDITSNILPHVATLGQLTQMKMAPSRWWLTDLQVAYFFTVITL